MSRSKRYPIQRISTHIDKDVDNKRVRRAIKQELSKPEPDEVKIEEDTREMGFEDLWAEKDSFYDTFDVDDAEWRAKRAEAKAKASRK